MGLTRWLASAVRPLVDRTLLTSYSAIGYRIRAKGFDPGDLDVDLTGRTALVTGGNSGIGFVTARELAKRGGSVWILCRHEGRGKRALAQLVEATGSKQIRLEVVDMSSQESLRAFASRFTAKRVDILVHSAAVLASERHVTPDGIEQTVATNLVGPYLLTELLEAKLAASDDARLVLVSSGGMYPRKLDVATLEHGAGKFDGVSAYADSKRALVELGEHWAHELPASITVATMHPGWADTPAVQVSLPTFRRLTSRLLRSPEQGADTVVWLAASPRAKGRSGLFWFDREPWRTHLVPWTRTPAGERERLMAALKTWTVASAMRPAGPR